MKMSQYFPAPLSHKENIKVEIDLSNHATKKISMILLMQILQTLH